MTTTPILLPASVAPRSSRRNRARLLESFDAITESCSRILATDHGHFESEGELYSMPRFVYVGHPGGGEMIRLGVFATLHGDEPEGALALVRFLERLAESPDLGQGFGLFLYPLCNPTGFEDHQREARTGVDLNREFWRNSLQPEVQFLESEIQSQSFHGIISLHSDDTSDGLYGFVRGAVLSEHLLEPALRQGNRFLPRNRRPQIDGFAARESIIHSGYPGMLQSAPETPRRPFEITWETPQKAPLDRQVSATVAGLEAILAEYRRIQSFANHI